jgi:hypothetical protein
MRKQRGHLCVENSKHLRLCRRGHLCVENFHDPQVYVEITVP